MAEFFKHIEGKVLGFSWQDAVDIVIVAVLLYLLFLFLKKNNSTFVFKILPFVLVIAPICVAIGFTTTHLIIKIAYLSFALFVVIIFARELKRDIWRINVGRTESYSGKEQCSEDDLRVATNELIKSVQNMAKNDTGAIIVIAQNHIPKSITESGVMLNAEVSSQLIESIFNTKAPLHDGAILVHNNKIIAAGCFLPLAQELNLPKELGTRHRAGIGISEAEDVTCIVVSEETGIISIAENGKLRRYVDGQILTETLEKLYNIGSAPSKNGKLQFKRR